MTHYLILAILCPVLNFLTLTNIIPPTANFAPLILAYEPTEHASESEPAHQTEEEIITQMEADIEPDNWAESFLFTVVSVGILTLTVGLLLSFYRIVRGPQLADRVLAGDTFSLHVVGLVILLAIRLHTEVFFDAALVVAIIGFVSTLAFAQYIGNRRKRTPIT